MAVTTGMKGDGFYDANSAAQRTTIAMVDHWLEQSAEQLSLPGEDGCIRLMDIGCSEGGNAIDAIKPFICQLRRRSKADICMLFSDLPTNNFNQVFHNLYPDGEHHELGERVYAASVAGSMYERLVPDGSLTMAMTYNAMGYLSRPPATSVPDHILPMPPNPRNPDRVSDAQRAPYRDQADKDVKRFLQMRSREIHPGGRLLVQIFGRNDEHSTSDGMYDMLNDTLREMVAQGSFPQSVYEQMVFSIWMRNLDELVEPWQSDPPLMADYRLLDTHTGEVPVPFNLELEKTGDLATWAASYTRFLRAFSEPMVVSFFTPDMDRQTLADEIYMRVEQRALADPETYAFHYIVNGMLLERL